MNNNIEKLNGKTGRYRRYDPPRTVRIIARTHRKINLFVRCFKDRERSSIIVHDCD